MKNFFPEKTACTSCGPVVLDRNGDCPQCRRNVVAIEKAADEKLRFFCVVCNENFVSQRDNTGYDQAPCPKCGDLSTTDEFDAGENVRTQRQVNAGWYWIIYILAMLVTSGLGWVMLNGIWKR